MTKMLNPLISVIVPVYNVEKYLHRCVDSILSQTYTNLEVILIDDGSSDRCGKICDEYAAKDERIKVIHQENAGVSAARNAGLDIATGDYISFVDSDDFIELNCFSALLNEFEESIDIVSGMSNHIDALSGIAEMSVDVSKAITLCINEDFNINSMASNYVVWGKLYRSRLLNNLRFREDIYLGEDSLFVAEAIKATNEIKYLPDCIYNYFIYDKSLSHGKVNKKSLSVTTALLQICKMFSENSKSKEPTIFRYLETGFGLYKSALISGSKELCDSLSEILTNDESTQIIKSLNLNFKMKLKLFLFRNIRPLFDAILKVKSKITNQI